LNSFKAGTQPLVRIIQRASKHSVTIAEVLQMSSAQKDNRSHTDQINFQDKTPKKI